MKQSKQQLRQQLIEGVHAFVQSGKTITKIDAVKPRKKHQPKMVEIEIDALPPQLHKFLKGQ